MRCHESKSGTAPGFDIWLLGHPDLKDTARFQVFREFVAEAFAATRDLLQGRLVGAGETIRTQRSLSG